MVKVILPNTLSMQEVRCPFCPPSVGGALLFKFGGEVVIEIKCPRCRTLMRYSHDGSKTIIAGMRDGFYSRVEVSVNECGAINKIRLEGG